MSSAEEHPQPEREVITGKDMLAYLERIRNLNFAISAMDKRIREDWKPIEEAVGSLAIVNFTQGIEFDSEQLAETDRQIAAKRGDQELELAYMRALRDAESADIKKKLYQSLKPEDQSPAKLVVDNLNPDTKVVWITTDRRATVPTPVEGMFDGGIDGVGEFLMVSNNRLHKVRPFDSMTGALQVSIEITYPEPAQNT